MFQIDAKFSILRVHYITKSSPNSVDDYRVQSQICIHFQIYISSQTVCFQTLRADTKGKLEFNSTRVWLLLQLILSSNLNGIMCVMRSLQDMSREYFVRCGVCSFPGEVIGVPPCIPCRFLGVLSILVQFAILMFWHALPRD